MNSDILNLVLNVHAFWNWGPGYQLERYWNIFFRRLYGIVCLFVARIWGWSCSRYSICFLQMAEAHQRSKWRFSEPSWCCSFSDAKWFMQVCTSFFRLLNTLIFIKVHDLAAKKCFIEGSRCEFLLYSLFFCKFCLWLLQLTF